MSFQTDVQREVARVQKNSRRADCCQTCGGAGYLNHPPGPVAIGTPLPTCEACGGDGRKKNAATAS